MQSNTGALVTTGWLAEHLEAPDVRVADATWFLPSLNRDARKDYQEVHIPGSVFFDIDEIADDGSDLPHMVPGAAKFSSRVRRLGLGDGVRIVLYDNNRFSASARAWWMFRLFGHQDVVVLDGGLNKWQAEGLPVSDDDVTPTERHFTVRQNNLLLRNLEQIRAHVVQPREQLLDARPAARFLGIEPEPRPQLRSGHIPHSMNLPHTELIAEDGTLLPPSRLQQKLESAGIDLSRPVVTSCGSGVTACTLALGLYQIGIEQVAVYDGSWSEWGGRQDTPINAA